MNKFLTDLKIPFITHYELGDVTVDAYYPELKIAFKVIKIMDNHIEVAPKGRNQLKYNYDVFNDNGVRLIQIWETEWDNLTTKLKCQRTITHFLGLSPKGDAARKCRITEISWKIAKAFLIKYHNLGSGVCGNYRIGAYDSNNNLVGVQTYGIPSDERGVKGVIELKRFVTDGNTHAGLASKMIKYAFADKKYDTITAFADKKWFNAGCKSYSGAVLIGESNPALFYTNGARIFQRRFIQKPALVENGWYDMSMSKREMLKDIGFYQIYDAGKNKLKWVNGYQSPDKCEIT